ncbi:MAG: ATP-dependent DNA helicase RecG [Bauldia sp.]
MRPAILNPLFAPVSSLPGVGEKTAGLFSRLLGTEEEARVADLLFHLPVALIDRRRRPGIALSGEGGVVTLRVRIDRHQPSPRGIGRIPYRVLAQDDTGEIALVFFHAERSWLERSLPVGAIRHVSGTVEWFNGRPQMVHPDYIVAEADAATIPEVEPIYPMTEGLARKVVRKAVEAALSRIPALPEWAEPATVAAKHWPSFAEALGRAHHPQSPADLEPNSPHRERLAYDEVAASQIALALTRARIRRPVGKSRRGDGSRSAAIRAALPFALTASQERAVGEINADLAAPGAMLRLLQGDVGSGKTIVALLAMSTAVEAGGQAALLAPTEVLARQHFQTIQPLAEKAGLRLALLTGRERGKERDALLAALAAGEIDILLGTHAIFQTGVEFRDLALAVVDEQHRFGVHQRLALAAKGERTDVLVMTATPIPRTMVLAFFGDMDVSQLTEKPKNRLPIDTRAVPLSRLGEVVGRVGEAAKRGEKTYWVCPLVEESAEVDAAAAEDRAADLREKLGADIVELVHGRMKAADKDRAIERFRSGAARVLVATTVIEVGVDVPDATIMVIEHAERFGLAQLHQLRGRVGRGALASTCVLLYRAPLGETAKARLTVLRDTDDGFVIAEEDLRLRGEGELLGTRQSGMPGFRLASAEHHSALMELARQDARATLVADPDLAGPRGQALRVLLHLFGRDAAVRLLRAG